MRSAWRPRRSRLDATTTTLRAAAHELADELGNSCDEMLAVVDDDQRPLGAERGDDRRCDLDSRPVANLQRLSKRRRDRGLVSQRRQRDPVHAIGESLRRLGGGLERESRLPRSPGSGERDEPRILAVEELDDLPELAFATEEGGRRNRKVRPIEALQGEELSSPSWKTRSGAPRSLNRCSPRSVSSHSTSEAVDADTSTWPPWPAAAMRAARWTSWPI